MIERMGKRRRRSSRDSFWTQQYGGMPAWGLAVAVVVIVALGAITVGGLNREDAAATSPRQTLRPVPTAAVAERERIAVVGDSNTEVNSADFAGGQIGDASWVRVLTRSGYDFAGGSAIGGTTSRTQVEELEPIPDADLLLIMTGTNDLAQGVDWEDTAANIEEMHRKVPAERVVLLAIAPRDDETTPDSEEFNANLQALAQERGWEFFDGMEFLRSAEGGFAADTSIDGIHLTQEAEMQLGEAVVDYLG